MEKWNRTLINTHEEGGYCIKCKMNVNIRRSYIIDSVRIGFRNSFYSNKQTNKSTIQKQKRNISRLKEKKTAKSCIWFWNVEETPYENYMKNKNKILQIIFFYNFVADILYLFWLEVAIRLQNHFSSSFLSPKTPPPPSISIIQFSFLFFPISFLHFNMFNSEQNYKI